VRSLVGSFTMISSTTTYHVIYKSLISCVLMINFFSKTRNQLNRRYMMNPNYFSTKLPTTLLAPLFFPTLRSKRSKLESKFHVPNLDSILYKLPVIFVDFMLPSIYMSQFVLAISRKLRPINFFWLFLKKWLVKNC
jgi:hypothetical protein